VAQVFNLCLEFGGLIVSGRAGGGERG